MKKITMFFMSFLIVLLLFGFGISTSYNKMVAKREEVKAAESQIANSLQRRADLITNLVATVKGVAKHEEDVFTQIAESRSKMIFGGNMREKLYGSDEISRYTQQIYTLTETYPELKSDEHFRTLMDELTGTENRIATERRNYNETTKEYNRYILKLPTSLLARVFNFHTLEYFENAPGAEKAPIVNFD